MVYFIKRTVHTQIIIKYTDQQEASNNDKSSNIPRYLTSQHFSDMFEDR